LIRDDLVTAGATAQLLLSEAGLRVSCAQAIDWQRLVPPGLATVVGPVVVVRRARGGSAALEIGAPGQFSVILTRRALSSMSVPPEQAYTGKTVCVQGVLRPILGALTVTIDDASAIMVLEHD
jgi:hypothetical protein